MKKIISLFLAVVMIFLLAGCSVENSSEPQISQNTGLTDENLAEIVAKKLGVPEKDDITYKVSEKIFWEAAGEYYKYIAFYENGEVVASASVNEQNGELLRNILKYSASEALSDKLIREIDGAYIEERKSPENSSTVGMVELTTKYTNKWKQVADDYYDKIMQYDNTAQIDESGVLIDDLQASVCKMKTNWDRYYKEQSEEYANTLYAIYNGGTLMRPMLADYKYELQKEWALKLVSIYEQIA